MNLLSGETAEMYNNPGMGRPSTSLQQLSPRHTMASSACGGRGLKSSDICYEERGMTSQGMGLEGCSVNDMTEDTYAALQAKKSPPGNGKKTKGRVKIKMEYIENKLRRYTTFSKRKTGIMKKVRVACYYSQYGACTWYVRAHLCSSASVLIRRKKWLQDNHLRTIATIAHFSLLYSNFRPVHHVPSIVTATYATLINKNIATERRNVML